jgi:hypothetical protein
MYQRGLHSEASLALTPEEASLVMTVIERRSLEVTAEEVSQFCIKPKKEILARKPPKKVVIKPL